MNPKGNTEAVKAATKKWLETRDGPLTEDPAEEALVESLRRQGCFVRPRRMNPDGKVKIEGYCDLAVVVEAVRNTIINAGRKA